jgi:septum formation protein
MNFSALHVVLGSRSPQRLALLEQILPEAAITIRPPRTTWEPGFEGLSTWAEIESRLKQIARGKCADVAEQCRHELSLNSTSPPLILTADTVIVANEEPNHIVLGQPAEPDWRETARAWFVDFLLGKTHKAATAVCLETLSGLRRERVSVTEVTFAPRDDALLEWYLSTEEPRGKAGGYGIQRAGSLFVTRIEGSLSNVIGLPLEDVREMLAE